jgi:hypothetical protein
MILYEIVLWSICSLRYSVWDLFSRSTSDKSFYSSWWIVTRLEFSDEDLLWSSLTDLLMIDVTAERKFYWLLASDVSSS